MAKTWRWLRWVLLPLLLAVVGWLAWTANLRTKFDQQVAALKDAGQPVELTDLIPAPVPEEENAAPLLRRAAELIGNVPEALNEDPESYEAKELEAAQAWLASKAEAVALLHEAGAKPACVHGIEWSKGPAALVHAIPWTLSSTRTLGAYARKKAREGDAAEALRCIETMFRIGNHMPHSTVICYLVRVTAHDSAMRALKEVARGNGFDPEAAQARLGPLLDKSAALEPALVALGSERAMGLSIIRQQIDGENIRGYQGMHQAGTIGSSIDAWFWSSWITRPFAYKDASILIRNIDIGLKQLEAGDYDALAAREGIEVGGTPYLFSGLISVVSRILGREVQALRAHVAVVETGLDALVHRKRTGRFPDALPVPLDPYTGQPLSYEVRDDGTARVAAARPIPEPAEANREEYEIAWELK